MAEKAKKQDAKEKNAAAIARTNARKAANVAKNQARYEKNLALVKELGLKPETREVTRTITYKKGKKELTKTITREKSLSPAELLRKHEREAKAKTRKAENDFIAKQIADLEEKVGA